MHHLPQLCLFHSCSVSRSTYLLLQWALRARFFMCTFCGRSHARLTCSVSPSKRTLPGCPFALPRHDFVFRLSGALAKRRQGFGSSQGERRLDIQTLCLQNQSPAGRDVLICKLPPIPLISIADVKYYNQDFKPGSSFLRGTFLSLFQSKIVLILFCWKQQWVPHVGFLVPSSAVFQGSLCRIPYTGSGGFPGFLMQGSSYNRFQSY